MALNRREALGAMLATALLGEAPAKPQPVARESARYRKLLWVQMCGGASSLDTFDPKEKLGVCDPIFDPIRTGIEGVRFAEPFPRLAEVISEGALFRARRASSTDHLPAMQGQLGVTSDGTHFLIRHAQRTTRTNFVFMENPGLNTGFDYRNEAFHVRKSLEIQRAPDNSYPLPRLFNQDPGSTVPETLDRIGGRRELLAGIERSSRVARGASQGREHDANREAAHDIIRRAAQETDDIDPALVSRYSPDGKQRALEQSIVTARELIRRGVFASVFVRSGDGPRYGAWDTHGQSRHCVERMAARFDHAVAQLVRDVVAGELGDTVLVVDTEFGRTPQTYGSSKGREHFPWHCSMLFSPNVTPGSVVGATNRNAEGSEGVVDDPLWLDVVNEALTVRPEDRNFPVRGRVPIFRRAASTN